MLFSIGLPLAGANSRPHLVEDFTPGSSERRSLDAEAVEIGGRVVLLASTAEGDLWLTDGRPGGTTLLADLTPGQTDEDVRLLDANESFLVVESETGFWKSDGTTSGTARLAIPPSTEFVGLGGRHALFRQLGGEALYSVDLRSGGVLFEERELQPVGRSVRLGDSFVFPIFHPAVGVEIGISDGTLAGTRLLEDLRPGPDGSSPDDFVRAGSRIFFVTNQPGFWVTDGTGSGTFELPIAPELEHPFRAAFHPDPEETRVAVTVLQRGIPSHWSLWVSDGTPRGTREIRLEGEDVSLDPPHYGEDSVAWSGEQLYFSAYEEAYGDELWVAPAPFERGRRVADLCPGECSSDPGEFAAIASGLFFSAEPRHQRQPLVTDGTAEGTETLYSSLFSSYSDFTLLREMSDGYLVAVDSLGAFVLRRDGLDGVVEGGRVRPLLELSPDRLLFSEGLGIGVTDGTARGTAFLEHLGPNEPLDTESHDLAAVGDRLFFAATRGFYSSWRTFLYTSDGTSDGTRATAETDREAFFGLGSSETHLFWADRDQLWASDHSPGGIVPFALDLELYPEPVGVFRGELYFANSYDPPVGGLYRTDLASGSIVELATMDPRAVTPGPEPDGEVYVLMVNPDDPLDLEVWVTDGTPEGTLPLFDAPPGAADILWFGGKLNIVAADGERIELWTTAEPRTTLPALRFGFPTRSPSDRGFLVSAGDHLFFGSSELAVTDGTSTRLKHLFLDGVERVLPFGEHVVVTVAESNDRRDLWVTDGTISGTRRLNHRLGEARWSDVDRVWTVDNRLLFTAFDPEHGNELWVSDGTVAGSRLVDDLAAGPASSDPQQLVATDDQIFFTAEVGGAGRELWAAPIAALDAPPPAPAGPFLASPEIPGFRVKVRITDQEGGAVDGALVENCIEDTLCVSGALPGRSEAFLRIVGPKPNGNLWPTLVKLTTSQVEAWIERDGSAQSRYYLLPGAIPGVDDLPALFDRQGFPAALDARSPGNGVRWAEASVAAGTKASGPDAPPIPPGSEGVESPEVPGFRFHVRLTSQSGEELPTREELACIEETVCISGSMPGCVEIFLRIIGPRPNGYLWPTIVRFTTSEVEVWVEQLGSGEVQYYRLPAASPGDDRLDGMFDRTGFL